MDCEDDLSRIRSAWNRGDYSEYARREVEFGFRQMREANVGKKRIVIELSEHEAPKHFIELLSKDAVKAGEDLSPHDPIPPRPVRVNFETVIPTSLNESFEKLAHSLREWDKRGAKISDEERAELSNRNMD